MKTHTDNGFEIQTKALLRLITELDNDGIPLLLFSKELVEKSRQANEDFKNTGLVRLKLISKNNKTYLSFISYTDITKIYDLELKEEYSELIDSINLTLMEYLDINPYSDID